MRSTRTITLFTDQPDPSQRPVSLIVSLLFHAVGLSLFSFGAFYVPPLDPRALHEHFSVRRLELDSPEQQSRRAAHDKVRYPSAQARAGADGGRDAHPPAPRVIAKAAKGPQTLVQPDLPSSHTLPHAMPIPAVVIWTPQKQRVKDIVAPLPEKATAADVRPAPDPPNQEINLADLSLASLSQATPKLLALPSTTSPLTVHGPDRVQLAPVTVAQSSAQPTPAALISVSDLRMNKGSVVLPAVNETAAATVDGSSANAGSGGPGGKPGAGSGERAGSAAGQAEKLRASASETAEDGAGKPPRASQITLPKDGQFGAVVVGASLEDQFPEMAGVWSGRLAYTVYLHVGLSRSWVLQYSLPRDEEAAAGGAVARLEAPWPYAIVRPNLAAGAMDADALMVHGYVNQAGRFENLNIAFPPLFEDAEFVLKSLAQWQFRPATLEGKPARVEILLIIPELLQ
jgi:hypothetical protein